MLDRGHEHRVAQPGQERRVEDKRPVLLDACTGSGQKIDVRSLICGVVLNEVTITQ